MPKQKIETVEYSKPWYRPQKTTMGKPGWFVDKRMYLRVNKITIERHVVSMPFASLADAELFLRSHRDIYKKKGL